MTRVLFAVLGSASLLAQSAVFEVASIRPTQADAAPATVATIDDGNVRLRLPLEKVICMAYEVRAEQVSGPSWLNRTSFDIEARLPAGAKRNQVPAMLQNLLAERFRMSVHRETLQRPVYALVIAKGGLKMKPKPVDAATPATPSCGEGLFSWSPGTVIAGDNKIVNGPDGGRMEMLRISTLVRFAGMFADRPVIDQTGLQDGYDIKLDLPFTVGRVGDPVGTIDPVMVNALDKLGLKLEPQKAPIEMIVVDRIQANPTED